jgi:hypothetical protein
MTMNRGTSHQSSIARAWFLFWEMLSNGFSIIAGIITLFVWCSVCVWVFVVAVAILKIVADHIPGASEHFTHERGAIALGGLILIFVTWSTYSSVRDMHQKLMALQVDLRVMDHRLDALLASVSTIATRLGLDRPKY